MQRKHIRASQVWAGVILQECHPARVALILRHDSLATGSQRLEALQHTHLRIDRHTQLLLHLLGPRHTERSQRQSLTHLEHFVRSSAQTKSHILKAHEYGPHMHLKALVKRHTLTRKDSQGHRVCEMHQRRSVLRLKRDFHHGRMQLDTAALAPSAVARIMGPRCEEDPSSHEHARIDPLTYLTAARIPRPPPEMMLETQHPTPPQSR